MKRKSKIPFVLFFCSFCYITLQAQETIPATGANATGSGGTVSYTVGQIIYQTFSETTGTVFQGVQQPYEISVVTAIENTEGITLEYKVYPNPTNGQIILTTNLFDKDGFRYRIYDLNGILLMDKLIESDKTEISIGSLPPSIYFLKVLIKSKEVKTFKIIKN